MNDSKPIDARTLSSPDSQERAPDFMDIVEARAREALGGALPGEGAKVPPPPGPSTDTGPGAPSAKSTSAAQLEANRRNAQRSTGPRTAEGKRHSSLNAMRHGAYARPQAI